jgi:hypothetical protein
MYSTRCLQLREIQTDDHDFLSLILVAKHFYKRSLLVFSHPPPPLAIGNGALAGGREQENLSVLERHPNNQYIALDLSQLMETGDEELYIGWKSDCMC